MRSAGQAGKPVLVLRDETERPEAVEAGVVRLVGPHRKAIVENTAVLVVEAVDEGYHVVTDGETWSPLGAIIGTSPSAVGSTSCQISSVV